MTDEQTESGQPEPADKATGAARGHKKVMRKVADDEKLPFTIHLEELRWRIIYCAVTIAVAFVALYAMSDYLFDIVRRPLSGDLVFLAPAEAFFVYLKISIYCAIFVAVPMILYQSWEFVAPGLLQSERRYTGAFVVSGSIFFLLGSSFCYFVVLPYGLAFLIGYGGEGLNPMISVGYYISFVFKLALAFGIIFQLPIVLVFLTKLGFTTPEALSAKRPYFIVGGFVISAILTPPDIFTQVVMAGPLIILFEISLVVSRFFVKKPEEE